MNLKRDPDGKVTLIDTMEGSYGRQLRVTAPTAREILSNKESTRYVPKAKFDKMAEDKKLQDAVDAEIAKRDGGISKASGGEVSQDILDAHNTIAGEKVENDDRLTGTGLVKLKVLAETVGRDVSQKEFGIYMQAMKKSQAA